MDATAYNNKLEAHKHTGDTSVLRAVASDDKASQGEFAKHEQSRHCIGNEINEIPESRGQFILVVNMFVA